MSTLSSPLSTTTTTSTTSSNLSSQFLHKRNVFDFLNIFKVDKDDELCTGIRQIIQNISVGLLELPNISAIHEDFKSNGRDIDAGDDNKENIPPFNRKLNNTLNCEFAQQQYANNRSVVSQKQTKNKLKLKDDKDYCVFCVNNKEVASMYKSHTLRDAYGKTRCPVLRKYICPLCGATKDDAHTIRYCNKKPILTMEQLATKPLIPNYKHEINIRPLSLRMSLRI